MNLATCLAVCLCLFAQMGLSSWEQLSEDEAEELAGELRDAGQDYGIEADENELLELLGYGNGKEATKKTIVKKTSAKHKIVKKEHTKTVKKEIIKGPPKEIGEIGEVFPIEGLVKGEDGSLYYKNEKVKRIYEMEEDDSNKKLVYDNTKEESEPEPYIENIQKIKSIIPIKKPEEIKSITPIKSINEIKSIMPIKSLQEIKSMEEVKSIQPVPNSIAKKFIDEHGLLPSGRRMVFPHKQTKFQRGESEIEYEHNEVIEQDKCQKLVKTVKRGLAALDASFVKELRKFEEMILDVEPILYDTINAIDRGESEIDAEITAIKSIGEITNMEEIKLLEPIETILPIKSITAIKSIDPIKSIQEVKGLYELTDAQAVMLRGLNAGVQPGVGY